MPRLVDFVEADEIDVDDRRDGVDGTLRESRVVEVTRKISLRSRCCGNPLCQFFHRPPYTPHGVFPARTAKLILATDASEAIHPPSIGGSTGRRTSTKGHLPSR